jgi:hypothetical protein
MLDLSSILVLASVELVVPSAPGGSVPVVHHPLMDGPWRILWGFLFVVSVLALMSATTAVLGLLFKQQDKVHQKLYHGLSKVLPTSAVEALIERPATEIRTTPLADPSYPEGPGSAKAALPVEDPEPVPPEVVAVISAAIHVTLREPARILSIKTAPTTGAHWAAEGRREIFSSHRVR